MKRVFGMTLLAAVIAGCATSPLLPFDSGVPAQTDLSGIWLLDARASGDMRALIPKERARRRITDIESGSAPPGVYDANIARSFPLRIERIDVSQTNEALFIKFDLARVHEYVYGEKTEVTVGQFFAERVSGWQGSQYVVVLQTGKETLTERYTLSPDFNRLTRDIAVQNKRGTRSLQQQFVREP